ncbi:MAG: hypothetical protein Q9227_003818 [Pyrenula ochraceoflavens]
MASKGSRTAEWMETPTGNKISKKHQIQGLQHVILEGKCVVSPEVLIRADLVRASSSSSSQQQPQLALKLGRYVFISPKCIIKPPSRLVSAQTKEGEQTQTLQHYRMTIGQVVFIGPETSIEAYEIGSHVHIGANVTIGNFVKIMDYVKILDNAVLPTMSVWPNFSVVAGNPARVVGEVGDGWGFLDHGPGGIQAARDRWAAVGPCQRTAPSRGKG